MAWLRELVRARDSGLAKHRNIVGNGAEEHGVRVDRGLKIGLLSFLHSYHPAGQRTRSLLGFYPMSLPFCVLTRRSAQGAADDGACHNLPIPGVPPRSTLTPVSAIARDTTGF